jgi:hypothetical protein
VHKAEVQVLQQTRREEMALHERKREGAEETIREEHKQVVEQMQASKKEVRYTANMHAYAYIHTYTHTHIHTYAPIYTCIRTYTYDIYLHAIIKHSRILNDIAWSL